MRFDWLPFAVFKDDVLVGFRKDTPQHIIKSFKSDAIAKRCPNGKWLDEQTHQCIPKEEWEAKYGKKEKNPNPKKYTPRCDKRTHVKLKTDIPELGKKGDCIPRDKYWEWWNKKGKKEEEDRKKEQSERRSQRMKEQWEEKKKPALQVEVSAQLKDISMNEMCKKACSYNADKSRDFIKKVYGKQATPFLKAEVVIDKIKGYREKNPNLSSKWTRDYLDYVGINTDSDSGWGYFESNDTSILFDTFEHMYSMSPLSVNGISSLTTDSYRFRSSLGTLGYSNSQNGNMGINPYQTRGAGTTYNLTKHLQKYPEDAYLRDFYGDKEIIGYDFAFSSIRCSHPTECVNPKGEKDTISFHFPPRDATSIDDHYKAGMASTIAHELGHTMGYQLSYAIDFRKRMHMAYHQTFGEMIPPDMDFETAFNKMKRKKKKDFIDDMMEGYEDDEKFKEKIKDKADYIFKNLKLFGYRNPYSDNQGLPNLTPEDFRIHKLDKQDDTLYNAMYEIESIYKELYGISDEDFNPMDVYSEYGLYGRAGMLGLDTYKNPDDDSGAYSTYVHERIAEAYSDVCIRGDEANSMSTLIVAYVEYTINQIYSGSSKDFRTFLKESMSEADRKKMRENRIIKFIY